MIAIVDYGLGNILAFKNIYNKLNIPAEIVNTPEKLKNSEKIILPGVGSFDWAMSRLNESGLRETLDNLVIVRKVPVLGVCVGMQIMTERSDEGIAEGLSWVEGEVKNFNIHDRNVNLDLPHMGWNQIELARKNSLFKDLEKDSRFYFLHSFYFEQKREEQVLTITDYNGNFCSSFQEENIFGVQFHPEKSHDWGIQLLNNFASII